MTLVRICSPYFVAGLLLSPSGTVLEAAPILRYTVGWSVETLEQLVFRKRWTMEYIEA